uniref:hypothetical protein n=1 Tax=Escherichia coli TaxID=562 RepID=UPI001BDBC652
TRRNPVLMGCQTHKLKQAQYHQRALQAGTKKKKKPAIRRASSGSLRFSTSSMFLWSLLFTATETSSFSLHEPSVFFKNFSASQPPQTPEKNPFFADACVFAKTVCGWGSCDDGDRTRESSATGAESFIDSGHLMSCHKNRM